MDKRIEALKQELAVIDQKIALLMEFRQTVIETEVSEKPVKAKKTKAEKPPKAEKPKVEKTKPNAPKFTAKIKKEFAEILGDKYPEDEKEQDALKKKFQEYANAIAADVYTTVEFSTHVANFVADLSKEDKPAVVGGALKVLSQTDLIDVQDEVKLTADVGIYLLDDEQVTGPPRDEETEDLVKKTFKGKDYEVDEATGRVYDAESEEFLGYARIKSKKFDGLIGAK